MSLVSRRGHCDKSDVAFLNHKSHVRVFLKTSLRHETAMPKHGFLTPKAISNRIKAKGMQKLRWYCQMCSKQCRDEVRLEYGRTKITTPLSFFYRMGSNVT